MPDLLDAVDAAPVQQPAPQQPAAAPSLLDQIDQAPQQPASFGGAGSAVRDLAGGFAGVFKQDRKDADAGEAFDRDIKLRGYMQDQARQHARDGIDPNAGFNKAMIPGVDRNRAWEHYQEGRNAYDLAYKDVREQPDSTASQRISQPGSDPRREQLLNDAYKSARWDLVDRPALVKRWQALSGQTRQPADDELRYLTDLDQEQSARLSRQQPFGGLPGQAARGFQRGLLNIGSAIGRVLPGSGDTAQTWAQAGQMVAGTAQQEQQRDDLNPIAAGVARGLGDFASQVGFGRGLSRVTGGAAGVTATMIGSQASADLEEARQKGLKGPAAFVYPTINAIITGGIMHAGGALSEAARGISGDAVREGIAEGLGRLPRSLAQAAGEMNAMSLGSAFARVMTGIDTTALRGENLPGMIADATVNGIALGLVGHSGLIGSAAKRMLKETQARADLELTNSRAARQLPAEPEAAPEAPQGPLTPSGQAQPQTAATPAEAPAAKLGPKRLAPKTKTETTPEAAGEPPLAPGMVRMYHGGGDYEGGSRWLTQHRDYAEGYAKKSGGHLQYVDLPETSPLLKKSFDDEGTSQKAPYVNFEAPAEIAKQLKPIGKPNATPQGIGPKNNLGEHQGTQSPREPAAQPEANRGDSTPPSGQGKEAPRAAEEVKPEETPRSPATEKATGLSDPELERLREPGVFFHGSGTPNLEKSKLDTYQTNPENLFGQGIYFTDNPKVSRGYANARSRGRLAQQGKSPSVYRATFDIPPERTLDLEKPITPEVADAIRKGTYGYEGYRKEDYEELQDAVNEAVKQPGATPDSVLTALRHATSEHSHQNEIPNHEYIDQYAQIADELQKAGYDALTHTGGKRVGKVEHRVMIVLDPSKIKNFEKVGHDTKPFEAQKPSEEPFALSGKPEPPKPATVENSENSKQDALFPKGGLPGQTDFLDKAVEQPKLKTLEPKTPEQSPRAKPLPPGKLNDKAKALAGEHGIEASDLKEAAQHIAKLKNDEIKNRNAARAALSKSVGVAQNSLARLENKGQDYSSIKDLDVHAEPILREYGLAPEGDPHFDYAAAAADLLREGRQKQVEWHHASVLDSAVDLIKPKGNQPPPKGDAYEPEPYGDEDLLNHPVEGVPFARANEPHPQLPGVASQSHLSDPREPLGSIPGQPAGREPGPGQGTLPNVPLEPSGPNGPPPPPTGNDFQQRAPFNDPDPKIAAKAYAKQLADRADLGKALTTRAMAERDAGDKYIRSTLDDASRRLDTLDRAARRDFMWRYQTGGEQPTRELQGVADTIKTLSREFTDKVRGLGEGYLENFNENWLKQLWKAKDGTPVGNIVAQLLGNRSLPGPGGFLRRKTWETQLEGIEAGGVPLTENPVEAQIKGLIEMNKFYTAHKLFQQFEANGVDKFVTAFDKAPPGMSPVNDRMFTKSGPRDLKVREAYDEGFATDLENFLRGQGVDTVKALTMGTGPRGGNVWGYWDRANDLIKTRFNAPASVLAHEAGHWAAERTNLLAELAKQMGIGRLGQATRRLAELRLGPNSSEAYRKYVHGPDERAAVILDAYLNARDRMADMTPELHDAVQNWVRRTPGMAELEKIRPTLILGQRENSIPIPGRVELGKHHVPTALAKRLDNIVSAGLGETIDKAIPAAAPLIKAGTAFSQVSNGILNNVELVSGFHTIGGTLTRMASRFNQAVQRGQYGIRDIWRGDVGGGLKKIGSALAKGALAPTAPLGAFGEGAQIKRSIKQGIQTPETERIIEGGGRVGPNLELSHALKYRDAVREFKDSEDVLGKVDPAVRAIWNKGLRGLEFGQSHIMDAAMNLKLSAENEMMAEHERNNPNMSEQQRLEMRQRVNRLADSLYGQVVYDNWNVHKTLRQAGQLLVRALGWWHGTVHGLVYSPAKEIVTTRSRLARGENLIGDAMGHLLGVGLAGALMGGTYQKLKTGLWPQTPTDYFFPKTGLKRPDGSDDRLSIPGYPKSLVSLWQHPQDAIKNAESPVMNILSAYLSNRNYWGDPIYDENAPLTERAGQFGKYVGQEAQPFAVQGYKRQVAMGEHPLVAGVQSALGFTPASGAMTRSPAMQKALDYRPHTPQSIEEQTKAAQRRSLNQEAKDAPEGMKEHLAAKVESGAMTQQQADRMLKTANSEPLVSATRTLTHEQALEVWKLADDKERTPSLKAALEAKLTNHLKKLEPAKVSETVKEAKAAGLDGDAANRELIRSLAKAADQKLTLKSSQATVDRQAAAEKRLRAIGPTAKDRAAADDENSYRKAVTKTQRRLGPRAVPAGR